MSDKDTGGPAFPGFDYIDQHGKKNPEGMTLRDYFAAKAMQGMYASGLLEVEHTNEMLARDAYKQADAMIAARNR